eukprot:6472364-Amphidinium_carterae.1
MQQQLPCTDSQQEILARFLRRVRCTPHRPHRGRHPAQFYEQGTTQEDVPQKCDVHKLQALLTFALSPVGWIAVGQTPAIYSQSNYDLFSQAVLNSLTRTQSGFDTEKAAALTGALRWPEATPSLAKRAAMELSRAIPMGQTWVEGVELEKGEGKELVIGNLHVTFDHATRKPQLCLAAELLSRICGPYNGKNTKLVLAYGSTPVAIKRAPRHPCTMNWYLPKRLGSGLMEVSVGWKSQADTLLHLPQPNDANMRCRPKRFLVAAGAEYQANAKVLRGATVLPDTDGGRTALMWLLSSGIPREHEVVTYSRPRHDGSCEVRALRLWDRTIWLPQHCGLTSSDFRIINQFRLAVSDMQKRLPHQLAGAWMGEWEGARVKVHIECVSKADEGRNEELEIRGDQCNLNMVWDAERGVGRVRHLQEPQMTCKLTPTGKRLT